jgi:hypothetical protein
MWRDVGTFQIYSLCLSYCLRSCVYLNSLYEFVFLFLIWMHFHCVAVHICTSFIFACPIVRLFGSCFRDVPTNVITLRIPSPGIQRRLGPFEVERRFRGTYRLHIQGRVVFDAWFHACFFAWLIFRPMEGMFLRNFGWLSADYTVLYPRRRNSS